MIMSWRRCSRVHGPISRIDVLLSSAQGVRKVKSGRWKVEGGKVETIKVISTSTRPVKMKTDEVIQIRDAQCMSRFRAHLYEGCLPRCGVSVP